MNETEKKVIYLCRCILDNIPADPDKLTDIDLDDLYRYCQYHLITALVCYALESAGIKDQRFIQVKEKAIRKNMLLDAERKRIQKYFDEEQIWNMPLKGVILKELYPKIGMRQMSDNDILFDARKRSEVTAFMKRSGYHNEDGFSEHCDEWIKEPVYNYEMHQNLFSEGYNQVFYDYYKNIFNKLIRNDDKTYEYKFTDEDFYIYLTAHAFKHCSNSGSGIRTLIDCYVFLKAKKDTLDMDYISAELKKLEIEEFENTLRNTALHIFSDETGLNDEDARTFEFMSRSGTYGNLTNEMKTKSKLLNADNKAKYIFRRIFPNRAFYKRWFPIADRHPVLIPAIWTYRLLRAPFKRGESIKAEIRSFKKMDNEFFNE